MKEILNLYPLDPKVVPGTKIFSLIFFFYYVWWVGYTNILLFVGEIRDSQNLCLVLTSKLLHKSSLNNLRRLLNKSCRLLWNQSGIMLKFMGKNYFFSYRFSKKWSSTSRRLHQWENTFLFWAIPMAFHCTSFWRAWHLSSTFWKRKSYVV